MDVLRNKIEVDVAQHSDAQLKGVADSLSQAISQTETKLTKQIEVIRPPRPELVKIQFSFYVPDANHFPLLVEPLRIAEDGTFHVDFIGENVSSVQAEALEIWIQICGACSYAKEINGFEKISGQSEHVRHRYIGNVNPGTFSAEMTAQIRLPSGLPFFDTSFSYSCANCGTPERWGETLKAIVLR